MDGLFVFQGHGASMLGWAFDHPVGRKSFLRTNEPQSLVLSSYPVQSALLVRGAANDWLAPETPSRTQHFHREQQLSW
jgi:hypothetical protein